MCAIAMLWGRRRLGWLCYFAICSCTATTPAPHSPATTPGADPATPTLPATAGQPPGQAQGARPLAPGATFLQLLQTIQQQADTAAAPCLLTRTRDGYQVGARLALATRGWPQTPQALQAPAPTDRLTALTRWGQLGAADAGPVVVAVTELPAAVTQAPSVALLLGAEGPVHLLATDAPPQSLPDPPAVGAAAAAAERRGVGSIFISATRDTPLARLAQVLGQLPRGPAVAVAIALPPGTRMAPTQPPAEPTTHDASHCPTGLPEPGASAREGDLQSAAIVAALSPLGAMGRDCVENAGPAASAGGQVTLALRIGEAGQVIRACLLEDGIGDDTLAACLTERARQIRFPAPSPPGFVDVHLPLSLTPQQYEPKPAFCNTAG